MLIQREFDCWELVVPAKVNLFLEVLGRRDDGYHDLDTVMLAVSLCDRLRFRSTEEPELRLRVFSESTCGFTKLTGEDPAWEIPDDHSNLVIRALEALKLRFGVQKGMEIDLFKAIPAQAGLGGGSANAAAAIIGGMLAWLGEFYEDVAGELASGLGSDINFFIEANANGIECRNWLAHCVGRGELVKPIFSDWLLDMVVVHPPLGCATKDVFGRLRKSHLSDNSRVASDKLVHALEQRDRLALSKALFNRLGTPATTVNPWIDRIQEALAMDRSVLGNCLSGSGSAIIALTENHEQSKQLADRLKSHFPVRAFAVHSWQTRSITEQIKTIFRK